MNWNSADPGVGTGVANSGLWSEFQRRERILHAPPSLEIPFPLIAAIEAQSPKSSPMTLFEGCGCPLYWRNPSANFTPIS
jgi:hypothetical protein